MEDNYKNLKIAERGVRISLIIYVVLSIFKFFMGYFFKSEALKADGINSSTDIIAAIAIIVGLKIARKPADKEHTYGHLRAETISSLLASLIMIAVGVDVVYNGVKNTIFLRNEKPDIKAAIVSLICASVVYTLYRYNRSVADKIHSSALMVSSKDNLSDSMVGFGSAFGIFASQFGFPWMDSITAVLVGIIICKTGFGIFREAVNNLTDAFDPEKLENITKIIKDIDGVSDIKDIRARVHGNSILLDAIILVDPGLSVRESHEITEAVEKILKEEFNIRNAIIHVEPNIDEL
ncbi:cation diffusion facilitator family transporter [Clostridium acetobutylicum]|uniref:Predicted Co/Zn/Cd cation transporter n=1 Tax=Clostridium acetobutylicum (strain ATCC 824 / DSM 792 / JCM 1419 / IAM 19013 / LMG 5710 / NBRC 13948 / NRRL B-527 / VKM B-1787 / 2291 / W) TaxID=272562 RepID=Q97MV4_CLOAB|nr:MULTISPECIES: cation diffusion facilitator family transporter [Clostridium]AAK78072.1 Predicted Co/Zn/Cd cation transporter [Clostridium acetobutylicum ATCC 824]ADZ19131.1 Co/Zn/Cd cation transporter [Clostridium acetobutylicum EA 2018]AEI33228.1 Co/Zn/Cd cation transporter [Clostridium acetobutylicum DSM 1731]AWV81865.1 cation transporter [Clostridium acetobutylicum]MBC2395413.1 cation transporter [Clostridium acetobutylicum]